MLTRRAHAPHLGDDAIEPGPAVVVGQWDPARHLGHVRFRMEIVAVEEPPPELLRQCPADRGLAATTDADDQNDHDLFFTTGVTLWPPKPLRIIASRRSAYSPFPWLANRIINASDSTGAGMPCSIARAAAGDPPNISAKPSSSPQIPPDTPQSTKRMP